jgi:hypothetical protein
VHSILHKHLYFHAYKLHIVRNICPQENLQCLELAKFVLDCLDRGEHYLKQVMSMDEAMFHTTGVANKHNCHMLWYENPHKIIPKNCVV